MADYTYATSSKKTYDEMTNEETKRAEAAAAKYAAKDTAARDSFNTAINSIYDQNIKAQEETAAADTKKTGASYDAQFDANAASQFARERALKEQMANYGLLKSGYNATNRTALEVSRNNADAATRTARQQAVDAIAEELRKYKAEAETARATALAESNRDSSLRILENEQTLQNAVHDNVMDRLARDDELDQFAYTREKDNADREYDREQADADRKQVQQQIDHTIAQDAIENDMTLKEYVDAHNREIYDNMYNAYNSGNAALGDEYAKQLWQIDKNGKVVSMPFNTAGASAYTEQKNREEAARAAAKTEDNAEKEPTYNAFGFPQKYNDFIEDARLSIAALVETSDPNVQDAMTNRALSLLYLIEQQTSNENAEGYMDSTTFSHLLRYVGVTAAQYAAYKARVAAE